MADVILRSGVGATATRTIPAARANGAVTVWIHPRHLGLIVSSSAMRAAASSTRWRLRRARSAVRGVLLFMHPE